jgi:hypothetical protein
MHKVRDFIGFMGLLLVIAGLGLATFYVLNVVDAPCRSIDQADCSATPGLIIPAGISVAVGAALFLVAAFVLRRWTETGRHAAITGQGQSTTDLTNAMAEAGSVA